MQKFDQNLEIEIKFLTKISTILVDKPFSRAQSGASENVYVYDRREDSAISFKETNLFLVAVHLYEAEFW